MRSPFFIILISYVVVGNFNNVYQLASFHYISKIINLNEFHLVNRFQVHTFGVIQGKLTFINFSSPGFG